MRFPGFEDMERKSWLRSSVQMEVQAPRSVARRRWCLESLFTRAWMVEPSRRRVKIPSLHSKAATQAAASIINLTVIQSSFSFSLIAAPPTPVQTPPYYHPT
jgi:hypothetical protein